MPKKSAKSALLYSNGNSYDIPIAKISYCIMKIHPHRRQDFDLAIATSSGT